MLGYKVLGRDRDEFDPEMLEEMGSVNEDEDDMDASDNEGLAQDIDCVDSGPSTSAKMIDWIPGTAPTFLFLVQPKNWRI